MARRYGRVKFDRSDMDMILVSLRRHRDDAEQRVLATTGEEQAFHKATAIWFAEMAERFEGAAPGRFSFDEEDLRSLKSTINGEVVGSLSRYRMATDPDERAAHEAAYDRFVLLHARLEKPFVNDRSQDADEGEEDEQDNDADLAP